MDTLTTFGNSSYLYTFPPSQTALDDNFLDAVLDMPRLPNASGGFDAQLYGTSPYAVGQVRAGLWLFGSTPADLRAKTDALSRMGAFGLAPLYKTRIDGRVMWTYARVERINIAQNVERLPHLRQYVEVRFAVPDPHWYTFATESALWGGGAFWGSGAVWGGNASAATFNLTSGTNNFTLTTNGTGDTLPRIVITVPTPPLSSPTLILQRLSDDGVRVVDQIVMPGSHVSVGNISTFELNTRAKSARINNVKLFPAWDMQLITGAWFKLRPGLNRLRAIIASASSGTLATVAFHYNEAWK